MKTLNYSSKSLQVKIPKFKEFDPCPECKIGTLKDRGSNNVLRCTVCQIEFFYAADEKRWYYAEPGDKIWKYLSQKPQL